MMGLSATNSLQALAAASLLASTQPGNADTVAQAPQGSAPLNETAAAKTPADFVQFDDLSFGAHRDRLLSRTSALVARDPRFEAAISDVVGIFTNSVPRPDVRLSAAQLDHARAECIDLVYGTLCTRGLISEPAKGTDLGAARESAVRAAFERQNLLIDFGYVGGPAHYQFSPALVEFRELPPVRAKEFMPKDLDALSAHFDRSIPIREITSEIVPYGSALGDMHRYIQGSVSTLSDLKTPVVLIFPGRGEPLRATLANEIGNIVADSVFRRVDCDAAQIISSHGDRIRCTSLQLKEAFSDLLTLYHTASPMGFTLQRTPSDIEQYRLSKFLGRRAVDAILSTNHLDGLAAPDDIPQLKRFARGVDGNQASRENARAAATETFRSAILPALLRLQDAPPGRD